MRRRPVIILISAFLLSIVFTSLSFGAEPSQQIYFTKATSLPHPGTYVIRFSLWDKVTGGTEEVNMVWWEEKTISLTTNSTIKTYLGNVTDSLMRSGSMADVEFAEQYWVQIENKELDDTYTVLGTRTKFNMVPYALWSETAGSGGSITSITAGNGLTSAAGAGDVTLNIGAGSGITVGPDNISISTGGVTSGMLAGSAVTSWKIAAGAVTDGKITGPISGSKISSAGLDADTVDGQHSSSFAGSVHEHSGNAISSGTVLDARIDDLIARDTEVTSAISAHTSNASAHHTRYSDTEAVSAIKAADGSGSGLDADTLDGQDAAAFAASGANTDITSLTGANTVSISPLDSTNTGEVRYSELGANGANYVGFKAPDSIESDLIWTLPAAEGTSGQVLRTDGAGILSWTTPAAGSVMSVGTGAGLTGGPITAGGTISIANSGVTNPMLATGAVSFDKIASNAVTSDKIATGAVTDAKITGPISGSKISTAGLNADTVDGQHSSSFAGSVHTHSGNDISSGTVLDARIDGLIARDTEVTSAINTHTANASAHHARYTDAEAVSAIKAADGSGSGLDADTLDGQDAASFAGSSHLHAEYVALSGDQTIAGAKTFSSPVASNVAAGTAPLQVASDTMVANLNAEMLGGKRLSDLDARYAAPAQNLSRMTSKVALGSINGSHTSITIGTDGFPIISYYDEGSGHLKTVHCTNASCSAYDTPVTLDAGGNVGYSTSITIGTDGFPVISYYDVTNSDLKAVHCTNTSCSTHDSPLVLDSVGYVGNYTSITIGADGFPIISYYDSALNYNLKAVHCTNTSCSTQDSPVTLDNSADEVGQYTSITIGSDGYPIVSYYDSTNGNLKAVHCTNASCSTLDAPVILDSDNNVGHYTSIAIGNDGYPIISYSYFTARDLRAVHCTNASCTTFDAPVTLDSAGDVGQYTSITVGTDGFPIISYGQEYGALKAVHCLDASCSTFDTPVTLDSGGEVGLFTSITIGTDGAPVISYYDYDNARLKVAKCANRYCKALWRR